MSIKTRFARNNSYNYSCCVYDFGEVQVYDKSFASSLCQIPHKIIMWECSLTARSRHAAIMLNAENLALVALIIVQFVGTTEIYYYYYSSSNNKS